MNLYPSDGPPSIIPSVRFRGGSPANDLLKLTTRVAVTFVTLFWDFHATITRMETSLEFREVAWRFLFLEWRAFWEAYFLAGFSHLRL